MQWWVDPHREVDIQTTALKNSNNNRLPNSLNMLNNKYNLKKINALTSINHLLDVWNKIQMMLVCANNIWICSNNVKKTHLWIKTAFTNDKLKKYILFIMYFYNIILLYLKKYFRLIILYIIKKNFWPHINLLLNFIILNLLILIYIYKILNKYYFNFF